MRGWDEFSEFLLENRVPTSADFNTYPIRIFLFKFVTINQQTAGLEIKTIVWSDWLIKTYV